MRKTLRRSCDACARSKLRCDLLSPKCSRCSKRGLECAYANEPLSAVASELTTAFIRRTSLDSDRVTTSSGTHSTTPFDLSLNSFDPFNSYPPTRLPKGQVQRLIQHFLSNIAFQYYPLDLNATSNPFVVSWWPLALADPALFHVSLQTASLDIDSRAQRGFATSEILMADSVSLVRSKVDDPVAAIQDETLDSVVTLAAIEFGKGNIEVSNMHIEGVKSMIEMRGGIKHVKLKNPLTARMVSWVSLILSQLPQFPTQNDLGEGEGISPTRQWLESTRHAHSHVPESLYGIDLDPTIVDIVSRLNYIFSSLEVSHLSTTDLHDLACFTLHRLLSWSPQAMEAGTPHSLSASESVRYGVALYMLILHGPTYFSHNLLQQSMVSRLKFHLENTILALHPNHVPLAIWLISIGLISSEGFSESKWFTSQANAMASSFRLSSWKSISACLESVL